MKSVPLRGFDTQNGSRTAATPSEKSLSTHTCGTGRLPTSSTYWTRPSPKMRCTWFHHAPTSASGAAARVVGSQVRGDQPGDLAGPSTGRNGPTPDQVLATTIDLARGLVRLHDANVLHRDIKPDNSVLHQGRWKWCDLGTSRVLTEITSTYTLREHGTLPYQAPEVTRGEPQSQASDVSIRLHPVCTRRRTSAVHRSSRRTHQATPRHRTRPHRGSETDDFATLLRWMLKKVPEGRITTHGVLDWLLDEHGTASTNPRLGALAAAAERRQAVRASVEARLTARGQASEAADALLEQILWAKFVTRVQREIQRAETGQQLGHTS